MMPSVSQFSSTTWSTGSSVRGSENTRSCMANQLFVAPSDMVRTCWSQGSNVPRCGCRPRHDGRFVSFRPPNAWAIDRLALHSHWMKMFAASPVVPRSTSESLCDVVVSNGAPPCT
jgi:hypothetical protein